MIYRKLTTTLQRLAQTFPVIAITGPRQSGKTTLAKSVFADMPYVTLEDPSERAFALEDPKGFLQRFRGGAIFDEAQRWPDLFSYLQGIVDEEPIPGKFILTGSQQFGLLAGVSQSLAGRVGMTTLLPLSLSELSAAAQSSLSLDTLIIKGFYPPLHVREISPGDWFSSYIATYIERDIRQLLRVQDLSLFQRFVRLCAGRNGQLLNLNALASETGISHKTARSWLSVLESSYIIHLLPPYYRNFGKRLVKTPKLYFFDQGLACWLLGIRSSELLTLHPMRGAIFESFIISEFLKSRYNQGLPADLYFWRDNNGLETDIVFERGTKLQPVEIKSGQTITSDSIRAGQKAARFAGEEALEPWLIYGGDDSYERNGVTIMSWRDCAQWAEIE
jgi:uncharacterized protein